MGKKTRLPVWNIENTNENYEGRLMVEIKLVTQLLMVVGRARGQSQFL